MALETLSHHRWNTASFISDSDTRGLFVDFIDLIFNFQYQMIGEWSKYAK